MAFLNPAAFYLLGIIPIVIALHFLKLRRKRFVVPSMMLWRASAEDQKANVPFQRLRNLLLPIIQSLFLLLIIASVARPALRMPGIIHGKIIYIVDNSASMLSKELGETRLALAKQEVLKHLNQVSASGGMMIMATHAPKPYIQQTFTTDTDKLRYAVENIEAAHYGGSIASVFDHAVRYTDSAQDQIFYISDSPENVPVSSVPINKIAVGGKAENIGIVKFSVERSADRYHVLAGIQNWTDSTREIETRLELEGGTPIDEKVISISAGEIKSVLFSIKMEERLDGVAIRLHLVDVADDFELDNSAWAVLNTQRQFQILLVSDRNLSFLDMLLGSYGDHVEYQKVRTDEYHGIGDVDVVIFDKGPLTEQSLLDLHGTQSAIFINWQGALPFMTDSPIEVIRTPVRVIKENRTHPIMQDVSLMDMQIKESIHRKLPIWGDSLLETEKGSLIWLGEYTGEHYLVFEFDVFNPEYSAFTTTIPSGPLLIYQCLAWLESRTFPIRSIAVQADNAGQTFRAGEHLTVQLSTEETSIFQVKKPDGTMVELDSSVFIGTDQIGVYAVFAGDVLFERFTANLLDTTESDLSLSKTEPNIPEQASEKESLQPITREIWHWLVLFAVGLLLFEWWCYHRT